MDILECEFITIQRFKIGLLGDDILTDITHSLIPDSVLVNLFYLFLIKFGILNTLAIVPKL